MKGPSDPHAVAFLGISPLTGTTVFPFVYHGSGHAHLGIRHGLVEWRQGIAQSRGAQGLAAVSDLALLRTVRVVMPKGAGHQAVTTNVVKFLVTGK